MGTILSRAQERIFTSLPPPPSAVFSEYREIPNSWLATNNPVANKARWEYLDFPNVITNAMSETTALHHKIYGRLENLYALILVKELLENPKYSALVKESYSLGSGLRWPNGAPFYSICDHEIGLREAFPPPGLIPYEIWFPELTKRYGKLVVKVGEIAKRENLSDELIAGIKNDTVKRVLEGAVGLIMDAQSAENAPKN